MNLLDQLNQYSGLLALIGSFIVVVGGFVLKAHVNELVKDRATVTQHNSLAKEVDGHGDRITAIEASLKHLPTGQVLHDLALSVENLRGEIKKTGAEMGGIKELLENMTRQVQVMDTFLRNLKR